MWRIKERNSAAGGTLIDSTPSAVVLFTSTMGLTKQKTKFFLSQVTTDMPARETWSSRKIHVISDRGIYSFYSHFAKTGFYTYSEDDNCLLRNGISPLLLLAALTVDARGARIPKVKVKMQSGKRCSTAARFWHLVWVISKPFRLTQIDQFKSVVYIFFCFSYLNLLAHSFFMHFDCRVVESQRLSIALTLLLLFESRSCSWKPNRFSSTKKLGLLSYKKFQSLNSKKKCFESYFKNPFKNTWKTLVENHPTIHLSHFLQPNRHHINDPISSFSSDSWNFFIYLALPLSHSPSASI